MTSGSCAAALPLPLAGQFVSPPLRTGSAGHAWVSLDDHCHLHYEILVAGLGKADDGTVSAHLHGFAELGELRESSRQEHKRLLRGFFGTEVGCLARRPGGLALGGRGRQLRADRPNPHLALSVSHGCSCYSERAGRQASRRRHQTCLTSRVRTFQGTWLAAAEKEDTEWGGLPAE